MEDLAMNQLPGWGAAAKFTKFIKNLLLINTFKKEILNHHHKMFLLPLMTLVQQNPMYLQVYWEGLRHLTSMGGALFRATFFLLPFYDIFFKHKIFGQHFQKHFRSLFSPFQAILSNFVFFLHFQTKFFPTQEVKSVQFSSLGYWTKILSTNKLKLYIYDTRYTFYWDTKWDRMTE